MADITPVRIQRKRTKGFNLQAASPNGLPVVYVGRPTKYGNPYIAETPEQRKHCVELFEEYVRAMIARGYRADYEPLRGKNLACFCPLDAPCHADVLLRIANKDGADNG